jgi:4-hydroxybenzoate polyprenyltransferase
MSMKPLEIGKAYLRTSRGEYLIAEIPALLTLFFLGASSLWRFFAPEVIEGLLVFILLFFFGFIINAYADQDIDSKYTIFKNRIPQAVRLIGPGNIRTIMWVQLVAALALTAHISYIMRSWVPVFLVAVGTFFGAGYSMPPLHFKVKGWLHPVSLSISVFFIPAAFVLFVISGRLTPVALLFLTGVSVLHYGIEFANQAIDYLEDRAGGVRSPPVRWGLGNSLRVALVAISAGMLLELSGLYFMIIEKAGTNGILGISPAWFFVLTTPIVLAGYYLPVSGLWKMYRASITRPIEEAISYMKGICRYNQWQASGILGLMVVGGIMFFAIAVV